jgi:hypothetical protein
MPRHVTQCPVCDAPLRVTELSCGQCDTRLHGIFPPAPLARLSAEHSQFIETFVRCRGIIRDVERVLGISYPTVRARLDAAITALDAAVSEDQAVVMASDSSAVRDARRRRVLRQVEEGLLDPEQAAQALRSL